MKKTEKNGCEFTTIDLFCGAGGITEGFKRAGFKCLYANDINKWAIETFKENHPGAWVDLRAVEDTDPHQIRLRLSLKPGELSVIVGGPPCQGFSINAPARFLDDPRNALFKHYVRFVKEFLPQTILFENVPGLISLAGGKVLDQIVMELKNCGYQVSAKILFAAHYGVPQERWRLILLGSRKLPVPDHPYPTHFAVGRANFRGGSTMVFRLGSIDRAVLKSPTTVKEALSDLPSLKMGEGGEVITYTKAPSNDYTRLLRNGDNVTFNHLAAKLSSQNLARLKYIAPGGSWRDIPFDLLPKGMQRARRSDHTKRYGRLHNDKLAATIMTKCDPHWGPVFLPSQDRSLTVREAARLQSFPDKYRFLGPRVAQYEQVGNAVPVLMAEAIAEALVPYLNPNPSFKARKDGPKHC